MFCDCPVTVGAPPNSATCPVCLGFPGTLPVLNRRAVTLGLRLADGRRRDDPPRVAVRPQELLLSGPAQGLPDLAVRPAVLNRRSDHDRHAPGREGGPPRADPSRGGRRQAPPRHAVRGRPQGRLARGLEPRRCAARRDRLGARPSLARGGGGLPDGAPPPRPLHGRLRRRHGEGQPPLRRQRLDAPFGDRAALDAGGDQERQLDPLRREGHRARDREAGRGRRPRREDRPGDASLGREGRPDGLDARQGRGARLPVFPGARPRAPRSRRRLARRGHGRDAGAAAGAAGAFREGLRAGGRGRRDARLGPRAGGLLRSRR